jgi:hypothetical protein
MFTEKTEEGQNDIHKVMQNMHSSGNYIFLQKKLSKKSVNLIPYQKKMNEIKLLECIIMLLTIHIATKSVIEYSQEHRKTLSLIQNKSNKFGLGQLIVNVSKQLFKMRRKGLHNNDDVDEDISCQLLHNSV